MEGGEGGRVGGGRAERKEIMLGEDEDVREQEGKRGMSRWRGRKKKSICMEMLNHRREKIKGKIMGLEDGSGGKVFALQTQRSTGSLKFLQDLQKRE